MPDKIFEEKKKFINQVTKDLDRRVVGLSEQLLKVIIQEFVDKLDRNGDVILNNSKNLKLIAAIDKVYQKFMGQVGGGIAKRIADGSSRIMAFNADYYSQYKKTEDAYKNSTAAVEKIINDRLGIGDKVNLVEGGYMDSLLKDPTAKNAIKNLSYKEVIKGAGFKGFKKGLEKLIVGDEEKYGAFRQHYRNYAYDSFVQVDRDQSMLLAKDLDLQYFIYEGGLIDSSREFCIKRAGEVFSIKEAELWENDPWIRKNLEKGYITSYNPVTDMGLFGCRHLARFVSKEAAEMLRPDLKKADPPVPKSKETPTNFSDSTETKKNLKVSESNYYDVKKKHSIGNMDILNLSGGIPKEGMKKINLETRDASEGVIKSRVETDDYMVDRIIDMKSKEIYNSYMRVFKKGEGIGTNLLLNQVQNARKLGFKKMKVQAAGGHGWDDTWDGYYFWAKMGYQMDANSQKNFDRWIKQEGRKESTINEMVSTKEGLAFWKKNGWEWNGFFDLNDNSESMKILGRYLVEKKIVKNL